MSKVSSMKLFSPFYSLGTRIGVSIGLVSMLIALAFTFIAGEKAKEELTTTIGINLSELAFQMAGRLDKDMYERFREIKIVSGLPVITDKSAPNHLKSAMLERIKKDYAIHAWLGITDDKGRVLAATDGLLEGLDVSARPWFTGALKGPYVGDVHGALLLSKHLPAPSGEALRFVDVAAPIHDSKGNLIGVISSHLNWEWVKEVRDSLFKESELRRNAQIFVLSHKGEILLNPLGKDAALTELSGLMNEWLPQAKGKGYIASKWPDGKVYLNGIAATNGYLDYPGLGWVVVVRVPINIAFAPAWQIQFWIFGYGFLISLLMSLIGWLISIRFTSPLKKISDVADLMSRTNDHDVVIPVFNGRDETAVLSRSIHGLVEELQKRNREIAEARDRLEDKVVERTAQLQESNTKLLHEIDERKKAEEEVKQTVHTLNEAQKIARMGSFKKFNEGSILWSEGFYRLLNIEPSNTLPSYEMFIEKVHPDSRAALNDFIQDNNNEGQVFEFMMQTASGEIGYFSLQFVIMNADNAIVGRHCTIIDITERKKSELLKEDVDRIMRHDLKTPLNAVINLPLLMLDDESIQGENREYLELISQSGYRMLDQINNSFTLYKIETGSYRLESQMINIVDIIKRQISEVNPMAEKREVNLSFLYKGQEMGHDADFKINGDKMLCHSMLGNLIKNAIEASPQEGAVKICLDEHERYALITIHNMGVVPAEIRDRFFDKYSTAGKKDGTGIGTYSARLAVEAHGGRISFETSEEGGTTIFVYLPIDSAHRV